MVVAMATPAQALLQPPSAYPLQPPSGECATAPARRAAEVKRRPMLQPGLGALARTAPGPSQEQSPSVQPPSVKPPLPGTSDLDLGWFPSQAWARARMLWQSGKTTGA